VAQSEANERAFGGQVDKPGQRVGLPQLHVAALIECGTHAPVDAELGRYDDSERLLATALVRSLRSDMLVIQDRGFMEVRLWRAYRKTGAHLLWRVSANVATKVVTITQAVIGRSARGGCDTASIGGFYAKRGPAPQ